MRLRATGHTRPAHFWLAVAAFVVATAILLVPAARAPGALRRGPTEGMLAFVRATSDASHIHVISVDGRGLRRITTNRRGTDEAPAWSPDRTRIVFSRSVDRGRSFGLYVANTRTRAVRRLTPKTAGFAQSPGWSPDGRSIAFSASGGPFVAAAACRADVFTIRPDGRGLRRLIRNAESPAWPPDGRRVAFVRTDPQERMWIYVAPRSGRNGRRVALGSHPTWSPDGRRIAFTAARRGITQVYVLAIGGGRPHRVTTGRHYQLEPAWSPDGRWIAFYSARGGRQAIHVGPAAGGPAHRVTRPGPNAGDSEPAWRP
jgi:Tol biopolymer transport system component